MTTITATLPIEKFVTLMAQCGEYRWGKCLICDATGLLHGSKLGFPHSAVSTNIETLKHSDICSVNSFLNDDGSLKEPVAGEDA